MDVILIVLLFLNVEPVSREAGRLLLVEVLESRRQFYLDTGVLAEDEADFYFRGEWSFASDEELMLERMREAEIDLPPVLDCYRLPDNEHAREQFRLGYRYIDYLERMRPFADPLERERIEYLLWETKWRCAVWDLISDCTSSYPGRCGRRVALQRLRKLMGRVAYNRCEFPDPLPQRAFEDLDWMTPPPPTEEPE